MTTPPWCKEKVLVYYIIIFYNFILVFFPWVGCVGLGSLLLLLLLLKKIINAMPGEPLCHSPTLPTNRGKKEKGKIVEDKKGESN